jgi:hypothetical protein
MAIIMEVVGRDEGGNSVCRFRLTSDTVRDEDDHWVYRPMGDVSFGGHRLYSEAGYAELLLDAMGKLVDTKPSMEDMNKMPETMTQFHRVVDSDQNTAEMLGANGSYMLEFIMPSLPNGTVFDLKRTYLDTITFSSRSVHLPTTYGSAASNEVAKSRVLLNDTLVRTTVLDSVLLVGDKKIGYMTLTNVRSNALGGRFRSETEVERDMSSGIICAVKERCYRTEGQKSRVAYYARAELLHSEPISARPR